MFKKVGIIGVGLMGGSFAQAYREKFPQSKVIGFTRSRASYNRLKNLGILDAVSDDLKAVVEDSDLVVLGLPIYVIIEFFKKISPYLKRGSIVIDLGSTKKEIEEEAKRILPKDAKFVGCHPLCGSEKSGVEYARKNLYKNSLCIITSPKHHKATKTIKRLWQSLGSKVYFMDASFHDKALSYVSHLPHILSFSLARLVPKNYYKFSSASFTDMTRISSSSAYLWRDIFLSNKKNLTKNISEFIEILKDFKRLIEKNKERELFLTIKKINQKIIR
jgi:prephenate dehydrogenase